MFSFSIYIEDTFNDFCNIPSFFYEGNFSQPDILCDNALKTIKRSQLARPGSTGQIALVSEASCLLS